MTSTQRMENASLLVLRGLEEVLDTHLDEGTVTAWMPHQLLKFGHLCAYSFRSSCTLPGLMKDFDWVAVQRDEDGYRVKMLHASPGKVLRCRITLSQGLVTRLDALHNVVALRQDQPAKGVLLFHAQGG